MIITAHFLFLDSLSTVQLIIYHYQTIVIFFLTLSKKTKDEKTVYYPICALELRYFYPRANHHPRNGFGCLSSQ